MSDPSLPGELPPDLPPEYADAYRRAYERALRGGVEPEVAEEPEPEPVAGPEPGPEPKAWSATAAGAPAAPEETQPLEDFEHLFAPGPGHGPGDGAAVAGGLAPGADERPAWLVPALLAGLVVLLIAGAYGLGLLFSSSVDDADVATEEPDGVVLGEDGSKSAEGSPSSDGGGGRRYQGATEAVAVGAATGSCEAPPSVDAAGNAIRYAPVNSYDGDLSTAWRCNGDGVGQTLTLTLAEPAEIGEVGLVPGYAKTDPRSGADRYAENNRITRVRWTFSDGSSVVQELDGSATNRSLQSIRIPPVDSDTVSVEVLASTRGPRNTIAVSEVRLGGTTG